MLQECLTETEVDYFSLPRISNSDLSSFRDLIFDGKERALPQAALRFGTVFHAMLLEPHLPIPQFEKTNYPLIEKLVARVKSLPLVEELLEEGEKEKVILFTDPDTQARCRAKLDLQQGGTIVDFKTTYARTQPEFERALLKLDYDRASAFYSDSVGAENFIFIGVCKTAPFEIFYFDTSNRPDFICYGRKKYKALLKHYVSYHKLAENDYYKWPQVKAA